jgi:hypothetical protein
VKILHLVYVESVTGSTINDSRFYQNRVVPIKHNLIEEYDTLMLAYLGTISFSKHWRFKIMFAQDFIILVRKFL